MIGIISDSHGRPDTIAAAIAYAKANRCESIYHLGDICDSSHPETADACVALLQEHGVIAIKGNNDHSIVVNRAGRIGASVKPQTLDYLERLPLVIQQERVLLTHSLPFERQLGPSCMIRAMDHDQARRIFQRYPRSTLFRGHSHSPAICWQRSDGSVRCEELLPDQALDMADRIPCIVTCGALEQGFCMIWSPAKRTVVCRRC